MIEKMSEDKIQDKGDTKPLGDEASKDDESEPWDANRADESVDRVLKLFPDMARGY
jgi:hypothetical protein